MGKTGLKQYITNPQLACNSTWQVSSVAIGTVCKPESFRRTPANKLYPTKGKHQLINPARWLNRSWLKVSKINV